MAAIMAAIRFERSAAFFVASLAAMILAFVLGPAGAQPVTPPIQQPAPTFNPSTPNVVPQPPPAPVEPALPAAPAGPSAVPDMPALVPPAPETPQVQTPAPPPAAAKPVAPRSHVRRRRTRGHGRRHRYHTARVLGPSYYQGAFYPPGDNPCHLTPVWSGYYAGHLEYLCGW